MYFLKGLCADHNELAIRANQVHSWRRSKIHLDVSPQDIDIGFVGSQDEAMLFISIRSASQVQVPKVLKVVEETKRLRYKAGESP